MSRNGPEVTWYNDKEAKAVHRYFEHALQEIVAAAFPGFEFTHLGVHRRDPFDRLNDGRDEVRITLHLRPVAEARSIKARLEWQDLQRDESQPEFQAFLSPQQS